MEEWIMEKVWTARLMYNRGVWEERWNIISEGECGKGIA